MRNASMADFQRGRSRIAGRQLAFRASATQSTGPRYAATWFWRLRLVYSVANSLSARGDPAFHFPHQRVRSGENPLFDTPMSLPPGRSGA